MPVKEKEIVVSVNKINDRIGTNISAQEMGDIFRRFRCGYEIDGDQISLTVPTRRNDILIFEDVVEEVARIYGYDHIPFTLPQNASQPGGLTTRQQLRRNIKNYLQST